MNNICAELTVVELGSGSPAGSIAGMILADAGARVIKIEPPRGDGLRRRLPSGFLVWNRGKESVVADLTTLEGRKAVQGLAASADIVIDALPIDRSDDYDVGYDLLSKVNPRLVYLDITPFGHTGPYRYIKGHDSLVAAKAGLWARGAFGHRDGPIMYPVPWGSFGAAHQGVAGALAALMVRETTGRGQKVDATIWAGLEPADYYVTVVAQLMKKRGEKPTGDSRSANAASRYGVLLTTKDGRFIQTSTLLPKQGWALVDVAGVRDQLQDERFADLPSFPTAEIAQEFEDILLTAFRDKDLDHWVPRLVASPDVAFEIAATCEEGLDHPQIVHNGDSISVEDPVHGTIRQVGPVAHFTDTPLRVLGSAPILGAHGELPSGPAPACQPSRDETAPEQALAGLTIVEMGSFYAMPYGVTMAAALGARVIKLEDPAGDPHRRSFGPDVATAKTTQGKESVSLDLRTPEGQAIAHRIIAQADIFVNGYRAGVADRLGLGWETLHELNPRLMYLHAAGYGTDGPYAKRALYAQAAQAAAGSFSRQVGYWSAAERNLDMSLIELQAIVLPRLGQVVDGDSNPALVVLTAIALAAYQQRRTGVGQFLYTSMIGANAMAYADDFCTYEGKPPARITDDDYWGVSALDRCYEAADDTFVCVAVYSDVDFGRFAELIGAPDLASEPRFATVEARAENDAELLKEVTPRLATRPAPEWEADAIKLRVGCVAVSMVGHAIMTSFDPGLRESGLTVAVQNPRLGELIQAAVPVRFSETPGQVRPASSRGEHNRSVLLGLGYDQSEIAQFEENKIVIPPDQTD
ncbi:CaiB/BaiF CoA transferase family protein [Gordonia polyisoprenivorans]|uniref:CaiB/BaiF CoA transferase family protein n=1 Tax=Gordonia polyisoprenivorans TaxID=84595 RepID=UPI001AD6B606|nr:CoA transferase [Gordonia polyisoprenivorans]QTI71003.1 CoA transferase [Gordonia polyisoprenivorans]